MSRTYRRKNYHLTQNHSWNNYTKLWGHNTTFHYRWPRNYENGYAEKTQEEKVFDYLRNHTDKGSLMMKSPKRWYRKEKRTHEKTNYKKQFHRWMKDPDFEIVNQFRLATDDWGWY